MLKEIHCMYCGEKIVSMNVIVFAKAHVQKIEVIAVCEHCDKPSMPIYNQHDFEAGRVQTATNCVNCGSSINPDVGCCTACTTVSAATTRISFDTGNGGFPIGQ